MTEYDVKANVADIEGLYRWSPHFCLAPARGPMDSTANLNLT